MLPDEAEFNELLAKKEQEWKDLQQRQVIFLESALKEAKQCLQEEKDKFNCLKRDFTHNLRVLGERDRELEQYEVMYSRLKVVENSKLAEISDLKVKIEKLQQDLQRQKKNYDELQGHYQRKLKEHQIEVERVHSAKNIKLDQHREEYEKVKHQLERKIEEVQGDLSLQKQEMLLDFESEMKRREHEFRLQLDELNTLVLSHELKVKLLTKELTVLREMELKASETLQGVESSNQALQEALKQKVFEIHDLSAVKDARIKELQEKLQSFEQKWRKEEDVFIRKHEQLDRRVREKDCALRSMKEAHAEQVQQLESRIKESERCIETQHMEQRQIQGRQQDLLAEKDAAIEKLKEEMETLRTGWDTHIAQVSKDTVGKDLQIQSLQEENEKLKAQIKKYQKDIERYQQQLALSVDREQLLEQAKVQTELDWQKRCEEVKKAQYQHSEDLIERLTTAKEQTEAELKEKERNLKELKLLVSTLTCERNKVAEMLRMHSAKRENGDEIFSAGAKQEFQFDFASNEIQKLREQNSELRLVIGQMRKEMESLGKQIPTAAQTETADTQLQGNTVTPDYVKSIEDENQTLKQKCRVMEEQLQAALSKKDKDEDPSPAKPVPPENVYIQNYISGLNETIGALRADKVATAATIRRLEGRAAHLDSMVTELSLKVQQKQADVDHLQFQLNKETRHSQATISSLQQRQAELEMQLTEARKEAEEYFKGNLQQNVAAVGLGKEVSALKLELASQRIPVVLSESETVNHLRDEILALRQQLNWSKTAGGSPSDAEVHVLRNNLKEAAKKISQLNLEKQQLIDMGNRLRAEQAEAESQGDDPQIPVQSSFSTPMSKLPAQDQPNRLSALENLQYQLTSQELQYAKFQRTPRETVQHQTSVKTKNQGNSDDSGKSILICQQKEYLLPLPQMHAERGSPTPRPSGSWFEGDTSLQDVWKILDMGSSPSLISSLEDGQRVIAGRSTTRPTKQPQGSSSTHRNPQEKSNRSSTIKQTKTKIIRNTPKIRNYNVKD